MVEREVAFRMFAREFNDSSFNLQSNSTINGDQDVYSPNFLISPTGLKVNRVFVVGVITETDILTDQKGGDKELWRGRISDPTGAFTVYAGSYQPEASLFLANVKVPSYVMALGKVRSYEPGDGSIYLSLRLEEINYVEEAIRDRWIVDTAEMTLKRLEAFEKFFSSDNIDGKLMDRVISCDVTKDFAGGMYLSLDYYHLGIEYYDSLKQDVKKALCSIRCSDKKDDFVDYEHTVLSMLESLADGTGFDYQDYIKRTVSANIPPNIADSTLKSLLAKGYIYEPKAGIFKVVR
ncbi:MAG: DNA-binding protein [Methanolobus sp.]|nr:DNA-binding protein [Methanolobus sp.]